MLKIREVTKNDVGAFYDLIIGIAKFHNQEEYVLTNTEELLNSGVNEHPRFGALMAEMNGEAAGYLSYTWNYSIWNACEFMNLDDLFVLEQYRGQKIGQQLMQSARKICEGRSIKYIRWEVEKDNKNAINFYNSLGAKHTMKGIFRWELET